MKIRKKTIWVIVLTVVVFLSMVTLGIDSVYRIDAVTLNATVVSEEAKEEAVLLQERLTDAYEEKSVFSVDRTEAENILKEFPYFRLLGFQKSYPNRIVVTVTEDEETYAVSAGDGQYYVLGSDGLILGVRETYENRLDGGNNVLLQGTSISGDRGSYPIGDECFSSLLAFCAEASRALDGIRRNVVSVEVVRNTSALADAFFLVTMREGVQIYVGDPTQSTDAKAQAATEQYLSLSDKERLTGRIAVSERNGEIVSTYFTK